MMKRIFIFLSLLSVLETNAQSFFYTFFAGGSGYQGDLQPTPLSILQLKGCFGIGATYEHSEHWVSRYNFTFSRVNGDDRYNPRNRARNLSFKSNIYEFSAGVEYIPLDLYQYPVSPFVFLEVGTFKFSPFIDQPNGSRIMLNEYSTEGEGLSPENKYYKLQEWCIPFGGGIQWAISHKVRMALTIGYRKTFTDYLDDVSKSYVDQDLLRRKKGQNAVNLAYKGYLLPGGGPYPTAGTPRGDPSNNDSYYQGGISFRFRLNARGRKTRMPGEVRPMKFSCPKL